MKRKIKGLILMVCMAFTLLALSACGSKEAATDSYETLTEETAATYKASAQSLIEQVVGMSEEEIAQYKTVDDAFTVSAMESWESAKDTLGAYKSITSQVLVEDAHTFTITTEAEFEKTSATIEFIINSADGTANSLTFNVNETFAMQMETAGLNTLMGIGIVFCMLVFLSLVISLFKFIPALEAKLTGKGKAEAAVEKAVSAPAAPEGAEEELVDDGELVAVIAAAIAASENTSTDSFVVRSIRKSNRKWKRA